MTYKSPHKRRHTFGTILLNQGGNIRAVQDVMGHAKVTTTQGYTHININDLKNNFEKLKY